MQLEVGKKYRTRDGRVMEIIGISNDNFTPYTVKADWMGMFYTYTIDGFWIKRNESLLDLVEEVTN